MIQGLLLRYSAAGEPMPKRMQKNPATCGARAGAAPPGSLICREVSLLPGDDPPWIYLPPGHGEPVSKKRKYLP